MALGGGGKRNIWRQLWKFVKKVFRTLFRVTDLPRRGLLAMYTYIFKPMIAVAKALIQPVCNYAGAVVSTVLPAYLNPFHEYIVDGTPQDTYRRVIDTGLHMQYIFKRYVYTAHPHLIRKSFQEQQAINPTYSDFLSDLNATGTVDEYFREMEQRKEELEIIEEFYTDMEDAFIHLVPEDENERYRQAIGARTTTAWIFQKVFFWWSDMLYYLEWAMDYPLALFVNLMKPFGELGGIGGPFSKLDKTPAEIGWLSFQDFWKEFRDLPYLLSKFTDSVGFLIMQPLLHIFSFVNTVAGAPIRALANLIGNNWVKYVYFPVVENVLEPLDKGIWQPFLSEAYVEFLDPVIGQWVRQFSRSFFAALHALADDPILFLFHFVYRLTQIPGDLLYLVYLFFIQLEEVLYFYLLYPLTDQGIKTHALGRAVMGRIYDIYRGFIRLVGFTRPTAILSMSLIFTYVLVFFLNLVPM